jgi:hypothetical protein
VATVLLAATPPLEALLTELLDVPDDPVDVRVVPAH